MLDDTSGYKTWARVLASEYEALQEDVRRNVESVMDAYGATDPAEFFAVATETFFEKGRQLKSKHPALYEELKKYYRLDPACWR